MKKIAIIGAGFSGTMTAVHLIEKASGPIELVIINEKQNFNRGIAFKPYSNEHLLNVPAYNMSAFSDREEHFFEWLMAQDAYKDKDGSIVRNAYFPRNLYGDYVEDIWNNSLRSENAKKCKISLIDSIVSDLDISENAVVIYLNNGEKITADYCVIACGNHTPRNPAIKNGNFFSNENYFQNPWESRSVSGVDPALPVLILGNGPTMIDTVSGMLENKFPDIIYSISPNGFNILPHRFTGLKYTGLTDELTDELSLNDVVKLVHKHIKILREFGITPEPVIDSMRTQTQKIWQRFTPDERRLFMRKYRHLWGIVRSRVPAQIYDKLQQRRIENKLQTISGKLIDLIESDNKIVATIYNKKQKRNEELIVSRVINCTGPEADFLRLENDFLKNCLIKGIISQDELKLGINADPTTYQIMNSNGQYHKNLFTIGSSLKGMLWESIATRELRVQAEEVARFLIDA